MGRLYKALFNKNSLKKVQEKVAKIPFQKETKPIARNHYRILGFFWTIGIPLTLVEFYFVHKKIESEKKDFFIQLRDETRKARQENEYS